MTDSSNNPPVLEPSPTGPTDANEDAPRLIFDWRSPSGARGRRLGAFVILSFLVHSMAFYLFQVVYPETERFTPTPSRVTMLSSNDPMIRSVLRAVEDRVVYFDASTRETAPPGGLDALTLSYEPSFSGYRPEIRKLPPEPPATPTYFSPLLDPSLAPGSVSGTPNSGDPSRKEP